METNELMKELDSAYDALQKLAVQPTKSNVRILSTVLNTLENVYVYLKNIETNDERAEDDGK